MDLFSIYKVGEFYKYTKVKDFTEKSNKITLKDDLLFKESDEKLSNNLIRAKTTLQDLIVSNEFTYFCTFTFNDSFNRFDLDILRKKFNSRIRKIRFKYGLDLKFVLVPERHKNGAWHFHGCFNDSISKFFYINDNGYNSCSLFDYFGFNSFDDIRDKLKVSSYITKYITKSFEFHNKGSHLFFTSHNLIRPIKIYSSELPYNTIQDDFFDLSNNYCAKKYSKKYYNFITKLK